MHIHHLTRRTLLGATLAGIATRSFAGAYAFKLHNNATGYDINGFYTFQNGVWSKNWFSNGRLLKPGESASMDWKSDEGDCEVPFRVSWVNWGNQDFKLDWCKNVKNVYMLDKGFRWD